MKRYAITAVLAAALVAFSAHAETLRPEVGKPLQAAQELVKAQRYKEALAKVRDADAVGGKSAYESYTVERMRLAAACGAGDIGTASRAFNALESGGKLAGGERLRYIESLAGVTYRAQDYGAARQWAQRYFKEGGTSASVRTVLTQSQYLSGDYASLASALVAEIQATEKAGGTPPEERIKLLASTATKLNDSDRYVYSVEKLLTYYPKKQYWSELLSRLQNKPNFSDKFALDTYRLALATGSLSRAEDYVEFAQLAAQAGYPAEGKQVVDKGYAAGILGTGAEAGRHQRLRDLLARRAEEDRAARAQSEAQAQAAADGNALVKLGFNLVLAGEGAKGLALMQQGIDKGNLAAAEAAKLRLGIAQVLTGDKARANATFRSVAGQDGAADLARLWGLYARSRNVA
ncbi:MAG: hypothetical protein EPO12_15075 [Aquabacterium sp.]|nr:MAG: hypothetical protein EPO12_15075 [Aquabacterium sp.]